MTKVQAIKRMYDLINTCDVGIERHGAYDDLFKKDKEAIETVLSMLKEKDKEIEKKDKQIDLMANYIVDLIKYNNPEEKREVEEIKQYFERKCEE